MRATEHTGQPTEAIASQPNRSAAPPGPAMRPARARATSWPIWLSASSCGVGVGPALRLAAGQRQALKPQWSSDSSAASTRRSPANSSDRPGWSCFAIDLHRARWQNLIGNGALTFPGHVLDEIVRWPAARATSTMQTRRRKVRLCGAERRFPGDAVPPSLRGLAGRHRRGVIFGDST